MLHENDFVRQLPRLTLSKSDRRRMSGPTGPQALDFRIHRSDSFGNSQAPIPDRLLLIRPVPGDPAGDLLFLDQIPLPRDAWSFDEADRIISWRGAYGGGHLHVTHQDVGATGNIGAALEPVSVTASSTVSFLCDVALNTGATWETSDKSVTGFKWDPTSSRWTSAEWIPNRLLLSYTYTSGDPMDPPSFTFEFTDKETKAKPWRPRSFDAMLVPDHRSDRMVWKLTFTSECPVPDDKGPFTGPDSVYPYRLEAVEDAAVCTIDGVMQIDDVPPRGTLVGLQGVRVVAAASGFFRTSEDAAPFGVFNGHLMVDGHPAGHSTMRGTELQWSDLDLEHQQRTGLPDSGTLRFTTDGSRASAPDDSLSATRLHAGAVIEALTRHRDLHPTLHQRATGMTAAASDIVLTMSGLLAMTPFVQNPGTGAWGDAVQAAVTSDLSEIMNSFIPQAMWTLLFGNDSRPKLRDELAKVANTPVEGYPNPGAWYASLATAVLSQGLADGTDKACALLNGPRAGEWLKTEMAASKVYNAHSQLLFNNEWKKRFGLTQDYLDDQDRNAAAYAPQIDAKVAAQIADIKTNVAVSSSSPANLIQTLVDRVQDAGNYARTHKLYWPFAFYNYNTAPGSLRNIALQIGISTGSSDGTTLTRLVQQNLAVLTALDPSGFFARQYTATLNTYMATNVLPSMFGFKGDAMSFDVIKQYMQQFISENVKNENRQIAAAAQDIQNLFDQGNADETLEDSIAALQTIADTVDFTLSMPYVAERFVKRFEENYKTTAEIAEYFGAAFVGGVTVLAIFSVINDFKQWDKLTPGEKASTILDATGLGLQVFSAVVTRGVRVYAMFGADGMTTMQRMGSIGKILVTGEAERLDMGMVRIGNATARWLGDTEGTLGKLGVVSEGVVVAVIDNASTDAAEGASWAAKVFGGNLDEFIATRVGPVLIIAGIGLSIFFISTGESGIALASDIVNIVGGSLMLFASIGGWAIEGGLIAAEGAMASIIAVAGPLAVLAALAGLGLLLYQLFHRPPSPFANFVTQYAKPAGFAVEAKASAIDYAIVHDNSDQGNLLMVGFTLWSGGWTLACNPDGSLSLVSAATSQPNCVWIAQTDGVGQSQIMTVAQPDPKQPPVALWLSLMSDDTISFQRKLEAPSPGAVPPVRATVVTQVWHTAPQGNANLMGHGQLGSIGLTFQPVRRGANGNYVPADAKGWLAAGSGAVSYSANGPGTTFTLRMSAMAPNYMSMTNLRFLVDTTPAPEESFGPRFGLPPSTPASFSYRGELPAFLTFDPATGTFSPNGQNTSSPPKQRLDPPQELLYPISVSARNAAGSAEAAFTISVAPPRNPSATAMPQPVLA